ncbi:MAG: TRAP transporter small permease subunit [Pseudomonadota bacterium]
MSYLLLFVTFMAMPEVTRTASHVAVSVVLERLPPGAAVFARRVIALAGAVVCAFLAHLAFGETMRQAERGVRMMAAVPVPKAAISVWIIFGFASSALYFARMAIMPPRVAR